MMTVLLATRNRARILADILESFCNLQSPRSGWKLVVVDNASTDETLQVLSSFKHRLPLYAASEPRPGKNYALNEGLRWVEGDLVVLTDDDVFPHADWLVELRRAADTNPGYSIFGGSILPRWETPPPSWVQWLEQGPAYTLTDPSFQEGPINPALVFGPNMALRSDVFLGSTRFDPSIGPRNTSYPMGSETDLLLRLNQQGHKAWHVSGAVVEHLIRRTQLTKSWVFERAVRYGRGFYRMFCSDEMKKKLWMGVPRHLFRDIPKELISMCVTGALHRHEAAFRSRWRFNFLRGHMIEARFLDRQLRARAKKAASLSGLAPNNQP